MIMQWIMNECRNKIYIGVVKVIREAAFDKIEKLSLRYIDSHSYGEVVSRVIADADQGSDGLLRGFTQLFTGVSTILGTLGFMLSVSVPITVVVVLITPLSLFVASFIAKRTYHMFQIQSETRGEQTALIEEMIGNQKVPDGWIIVAAGNPPEYNKSVRDFDVVTLDRMKKIDVEADYEVWKEYAYQAGIHPAILAYLEIRKEYFYRMETTVDGKAFVTARGWEDLSQLLKVYEELGKDIDREVVFQYLQHLKIAKDFANYYELYKKYKEDYGIERILKGQWNQETIGRLKFAAFDEKLSVVGLLNGKLSEMFAESYRQDAYVTELFGWLKQLKTGKTLSQVVKEIHEDFNEKKKTEKLGKAQEHMLLDVIKTLESYEQISKAEHLEAEAEFERVREEFKKEPAKLEQQIENTTKALDNAFDFMEEAFGQSQEMVVFVTELNVNYYSVWFIKENGCDKYYQYNKGLLFDEQQAEIMAEMDELERKF